MPEYLVNMPYNLESWPFAIRSVTKKQALEWWKKRLYAPSTVTRINVLSKGTKMLVHRCLLQLLLLESVRKVQENHTAGNWAALEFEAVRLMLVCAASRCHNSSWKFRSSRRAAQLPRSRCLPAARATLAGCVFQECEKLAQWALWFSQDDVLGHDWT